MIPAILRHTFYGLLRHILSPAHTGICRIRCLHFVQTSHALSLVHRGRYHTFHTLVYSGYSHFLAHPNFWQQARSFNTNRNSDHHWIQFCTSSIHHKPLQPISLSCALLLLILTLPILRFQDPSPSTNLLLSYPSYLSYLPSRRQS
jgi:hypothetical protein